MTNSKKLMKVLFGASALTVLSAGTAFAQVTDVTLAPNDFTAAGAPVSNTFTLNYAVGGVDQAAVGSGVPGSPDAPTVFTVDRLVNLTVETRGNNNVSPGATNEDLIFSVLNTGNGTQGYALSFVEEGGDDLDTDVPASNTPLIFFIDDGDGVFEPIAGQDGTGTAFDPANPPQLGPDEILFVAVQQNIPAGATDGQLANVSLIADTLDAGTTTPTVGDTDGNSLGDGVDGAVGVAENVLADGTSTSNEVANAGDDSATGTYIIAAATIVAEKTVTVFSDNVDRSGSPAVPAATFLTNCGTIPGTPRAGSFGIPGSCVEYVIEVRNTGSTAATDIVVNDVLPPELEFRAAVFGDDFTGGSFTSPALPAAGTDCGVPIGSCVINLTSATLPGTADPLDPAIGTVTIRAIVK